MRRFSSWPAAVLGLGLAALACGPARPRLYGDSSVLAPQVAPVKGERTPEHVNVSLAQPANATVFLVIPGRTPILLFPKDSATSEYFDAGLHEVPTSLMGKTSPLRDSSAMQRRARDPNDTRGGQPGSGRTDSTMYYSTFRSVGYLFVFASQAPIPYATLVSRVASYTIPANEAEAISAVTKLLRDAAGGATPWAAYSIEYQP